VKALKYNLKISEGAIGWAHGLSYTITEFWIPDHNVCFNLEDTKINVFESDEPRNLICEDFEIEQHIVNLVLTLRETQRTLFPCLQKLYDSFSKSIESDKLRRDQK